MTKAIAQRIARNCVGPVRRMLSQESYEGLIIDITMSVYEAYLQGRNEVVHDGDHALTQGNLP